MSVSATANIVRMYDTYVCMSFWTNSFVLAHLFLIISVKSLLDLKFRMYFVFKYGRCTNRTITGINYTPFTFFKALLCCIYQWKTVLILSGRLWCLAHYNSIISLHSQNPAGTDGVNTAAEATDITGRPQTLMRSCRLASWPVHLQVVPNGLYPSTTLCLQLKFQVHQKFPLPDIYSVPQPRLQE